MRLSTLLLALLTACGIPSAAPSDGGAGDDAGSGDITADLATLNQALDRVDAIVAQGPNFDYAALQTAALQDPQITLVGTSPDGALWITANAGPLAVISIDPTPNDTATVARVVSPASAPHVTTTAPLATGLELPAAGTFRAYNTLGAGFTDPTADISRMLTAKGYTSAGSGAAGVEDLRGVHGDGVFFIKTHGAVLTAGPMNDQEYYALYTATPVSAAEDAVLNAHDDWLKRRVSYFDAVNQRDWFNGAQTERHYAITPAFAKTYMTIADHGIVVLEACMSASVAGTAFGGAFPNLGLYVGWDGYANARTADNTEIYLFDRMLGTNDPSANPESPKQRPFAAGTLAADMASKGLDTTTSRGGVAKLWSAGNAILAPSIRNIDVDENVKTLTLHGTFGTVVDSVDVDGFSLDIKSWTTDTIVTSLPPGGGNVIVTVHDHESNPVQLTDWNGGTFTYELNDETTGGALEQTMTWKPHFRADLHAYRDSPGIAPANRTPLQIINAADSTCHFLQTGTDVHGTSSVSWSGSGDLTPFTSQSAVGSGCVVQLTLDPTSGVTSVPSMTYMRAVNGWTITATPGLTMNVDAIPDPTVYTTPATWGLTLSRDESFSLAAGSGTPAPVSLGSNGEGFLSWTASPASFPPDSDAAR